MKPRPLRFLQSGSTQYLVGLFFWLRYEQWSAAEAGGIRVALPERSAVADLNWAWVLQLDHVTN